MLQGEHSAILSTFIKLPFAIKPFVLSIFEWPLKTGFTVYVDLISYFIKVLTFACVRLHTSNTHIMKVDKRADFFFFFWGGGELHVLSTVII